MAASFHDLPLTKSDETLRYFGIVWKVSALRAKSFPAKARQEAPHELHSERARQRPLQTPAETAQHSLQGAGVPSFGLRRGRYPEQGSGDLGTSSHLLPRRSPGIVQRGSKPQGGPGTPRQPASAGAGSEAAAGGWGTAQARTRYSARAQKGHHAGAEGTLRSGSRTQRRARSCSERSDTPAGSTEPKSKRGDRRPFLSLAVEDDHSENQRGSRGQAGPSPQAWGHTILLGSLGRTELAALLQEGKEFAGDSKTRCEFKRGRAKVLGSHLSSWSRTFFAGSGSKSGRLTALAADRRISAGASREFSISRRRQRAAPRPWVLGSSQAAKTAGKENARTSDKYLQCSIQAGDSAITTVGRGCSYSLRNLGGISVVTGRQKSD